MAQRALRTEEQQWETGSARGGAFRDLALRAPPPLVPEPHRRLANLVVARAIAGDMRSGHRG